MKTHLCLSAADIHGNTTQYEKIKQTVLDKGISFVFLCGDLLPKTGGAWNPDNKVRTIGMQKQFIEDYFLGYLRDLGKHSHVYAIFGNDDFRSNYSLFKSVSDKVFFLEQEVMKLPVENEELYVAGYPYISLTPFLQKDWEKWDDDSNEIEHKIVQLEGYSSENGKHYPINFTNHKDDRTTIANDLRQLAKQSDPKKTIYVMHEPPYNTPLDMIAKDNKFIKGEHVHIGSKAVRAFIEKNQPLMTMHGHIHETFKESGDYKCNIGNTVSITASNDLLHDPVAYVLFELPKPTSVERQVV